MITTQFAFYRSLTIFQMQLLWLAGIISFTIWDFTHESSQARGASIPGHLDRSGHILLISLYCLFAFGLRPLVDSFVTGNRAWDVTVMVPGLSLLHKLIFWYALGLGLFILLYIVILLIPRVKFNLHLGWRPTRADALFIGITVLAATVGLVFIFQHEYSAGGLLTAINDQERGGGNGAYWLSGIGFSLLNSLDEELWFRGVLLGMLRPFLPRRLANLLQAAVFGVFHLATALGSIDGLLLTGLFGWVMGWWTQRTGSIWPAVIVHFLADIVVFVYLY